jgi:acetylornithine deacetylase/succinyl-diaminopimelate desuccinylase-like protein
VEFDGVRAYEHARHLVEIGSRPPDSEGIRRAQTYIIGQLKSYGCAVEEHDFHGSMPLGNLAMKNIIAKIPGTGGHRPLRNPLRHSALAELHWC